MAKTPQLSAGSKADPKSSSSHEKPAAKDFQTVELGASKGADLHVAATAPAAVASLSGFVATAEASNQSLATDAETGAGKGTLAEPVAFASDPTSPETTNGREETVQKTETAPEESFSKEDPVFLSPADTIAVALPDVDVAQMPDFVLQEDQAGATTIVTPITGSKTSLAQRAESQPDDVPMILESAQSFSGQVIEDAGAGTVIMQLPAHGHYGDEITYSITDANGDPVDSSPFVVVGNLVQVAPGESLDFEVADQMDLFVTATTQAGTSEPWHLIIDVTDVAEVIQLGAGGARFTDAGVAETSITGGDGADQIEAHASGGDLIGAGGSDTLLGGAGEDTLTGGADNDVLIGGDGSDIAIFSGNWSDYTISESGGAFTITDNRDGTPDGTDIVTNVETFRFADGDLSASDALNDAPQLTVNDGTVSENDEGATIGAVASTDLDTNDRVTYSVDDARFEVEGGELRLRDGESLDFEADGNSIAVTVTATDSHGATDTQTVNVTVADQAEAITLGNGGESFIDEGVSETSITGGTGNDTISGHNDGAVIEGRGGNDALVGGEGEDVAIFSGNWSDYTISEIGGTFTITDNRPGSPDGTDTVTGIETFRFADGDVGAADALNDAPELTAADGTVTENDAGATIAAVSSTDANLNDSVTYSVDDARFEVVDGQLALKDGESLDYETETSVNVTVTATDAHGASDSQVVVVSVSDTAENVTLTGGEGPFVDTGDAEISITGSAISDNITGHEDGAIIDGAGGNDTLTGNVGDDYLIGGAGDDAIDGGAGNDTFGFEDGFGADTIIGGDEGADTDTIDLSGLSGPVNVAFGANEAGTISGESGSIEFSEVETLITTDGNDRVSAVGDSAGVSIDLGAGNDWITDGSGADVIRGGDGDDYIAANDGDDTLLGEAGNDDIEGGDGADYIDGGSGNDFLAGYDVNGLSSNRWTVVTDDASEDTLIGGTGEDTLLGGGGRDTLSAGADNDVLSGGAGDDLIDGGDGVDVAAFTGNWSDYTITEAGGTYTITDIRPGSPDGTDTVTNIETFRFSDGDVSVADALNDAPELSAANGTVAENDTGAVVGAVTSTDADVNDSVTYSVDDARFEVVGGQLQLRDGEALDYEADGDSVVVTVTATDVHGATDTQMVTVTVADQAEAITLGNGGQTFTDTGVAETSITGGTGNDIIVGHEDGSNINGLGGNDVLTGGSGEDTLDGGRGEDTLYGGAGNDLLYAGYDIGSGDRFDGGDGTDTYSIEGTEVSHFGFDINLETGTDQYSNTYANIENVIGGRNGDRITGDGEDNALDGMQGNDILFGGTGADTLTGGAGNDTIDGGDQGDIIYGGAGDDVIEAGEELSVGDRDVVYGGTGDDTITSSEASHHSADHLMGEEGNDLITSRGGADTLDGGADDDTLSGGSGNDVIMGGSGNDVAIYSGNRSDYTVTESGGTITVVDIRSGNPDGTDTVTGIETFRFADGDYSVAETLNFAPTDMEITANTSLTNGAQSTSQNVVSGQIVSDESNSSVDHWKIAHTGGDLKIDVFADGFNGSTLDSEMRLFRVESDGSLTQVAANDDGASGYDGSTSGRDSFLLEENLAAGTYVLSIGSYPLSSSEAVATGSDYANISSTAAGAYQITLTGDADVGFATDPDFGGSWGDPGNFSSGPTTTELTADVSAGTVIASAGNVTDADATDTHSFALSDDAGGAFAIDANGDISLNGDPRTSDGTFQDTISIVTTDNNRGSYTEDLGIALGSTDSDALSGTAASDVMYGFEGLDTFAGGAGDDTIIGGGDAKTVSATDNGHGTTGQDAFVWAPEAGQSAVIRFNNTPSTAGAADGVQDYVRIENTNDSQLTIGDFDLGIDRVVLPEAWSTISMSPSDGMTRITLTYADGGQQSFTIYHTGTAASADDFFTTELPVGDTATYAGDQSDYDVSYNAATQTFAVTDLDTSDGLDEGTDFLSGVETLEFADGTVATSSFMDSSSISADVFDYDTGTSDEHSAKTIAGDSGNGSHRTTESADQIVYARGGNDTIATGAGDDAIYAGSGDDTVHGGAGNDTIFGGTGADSLSGGDGNDIFVFTSMQGADTVDGGPGWTDAIDLAGFAGDVNVSGSTVDGEGWTMVLDASHSVTNQTLDSIELTDASGLITFDDGGTIDFAGIDRITF